MHIRPAATSDSTAIAETYNQGIEDRVATFETRRRTAEEILSWFDGFHPILVAVDDDQVVAFASTSTYRPRDCYKGIAEVSVYVARSARRRGAGKLVLQALITACEANGFWKLVSRVFTDNTASRRLIASLGFRELAFIRDMVSLRAIWRDVIIVERLIEGHVSPGVREQ